LLIVKEKKLSKITNFKIFDDSIHLFVLENNNSSKLVEYNIDTHEYNELMDYQYMAIDSKLKCSQPLYISYELSMISAILKQSQTSFYYLTQTYETSVWISLITTIIFLSLFSKIFSIVRKDKNYSFWSSIWTNIHWMLRQSTPKRKLNITQLFFMISLIPFTEIICNNLFSCLISVPEKSAENIDDLINGYYTPYFIDGNLRDAFIDHIVTENKTEFKQKIIDLNQTVSKFQLNEVLSLLSDQNRLQQLSQKVAILKSESSMPYVKGFFDRIFRVKSGREMYFQNLITPICFKPDFLYITVANNV
jgi:hypothetical protein